MPSTTQPLPRGQQLLLQRLMAFHVMSDDDANQFFNELKNYSTQTTQEDDDDEEEEQLMGNAQSLEDAFQSINSQLKPGFGLEIVTMVDRSDTDTGGSAMKYHAVVDLLVDDVSKTHAFEKAYNPHERAFIRLIMQKLVDENSHSLRKMDCINLRAELTGNFKLSLQQAERVVQILLDEHWLRVSTRVDDDDEEEENDDGEEGEGSDNEQSQKKKKRRRTDKNKRGGGRRDSVKNKLELAPRSYMELSHYLTHIGLEDDDLPQIILHRGD